MGRSSPAPEWWGCRPRRSFGTGEERPSFPATTEGESHIKAPPSTSEVARPSEVERGRLQGPLFQDEGTVDDQTAQEERNGHVRIDSKNLVTRAFGDQIHRLVVSGEGLCYL